MENRIHQIIEFADGKKYVVIKQAIYKKDNYYVAAGVTDDEEDVTDEVKYFHEIKKEEEIYIEEVTDPKLLKLLASYLDLEEEK